MNIREAILKAADSIEKNPKQFRFFSTDVPDGCGTPGCALGWMAAHLGWREWANLTGVMGVDSVGFYNRMDWLPHGREWMWSASKCAESLRQYADKYHPKPVGTPDSVLELFEGVA